MNVASARPMSSLVTSREKAALNALRYDASALSRFTASSSGRSISFGSGIGRSACASSVAARPSQKCCRPKPRLISAGECRLPTRPNTPTARVFSSVKARSARWHVAHETLLSFESIFSENRRRPSAILASVSGLSGGTGIDMSARLREPPRPPARSGEQVQHPADGLDEDHAPTGSARRPSPTRR